MAVTARKVHLTLESSPESLSDVIEWRLQACMAEAGIRFATDLHRWLVDALGEEAAPSKAHVSRLVRTPPERVNLPTLDALCLILRCTPGDLLRRRP